MRTTAREILADFPEGLDVLITGVGTGGHITGCARVLKKAWPAFKVFAVEPAASPVISGGAPSPHPIQGIGAGFIPQNLDTSLLDGVIKVEADAAREMARRARARGGRAGRHLVGRDARRDRAKAAGAARRAPRAGLQLRFGREIPLGRGISARRVSERAPRLEGQRPRATGG